MNELLNQFKQARIQKGYTQKQLAYFSGLSVEMIRKLEHGRTEPRIESLVLIAQALGYTFSMKLEQVTK